jgi:hypothetical protein
MEEEREKLYPVAPSHGCLPQIKQIEDQLEEQWAMIIALGASQRYLFTLHRDSG